MDRKTILVVEDDDMTRKMVGLQLSTNYEVLEAESAASALSILEEQPVDGVVSDYQMAGMNGLELIRTLRLDHRWYKLPVVMISGFLNQERINSALAIGVTECLRKPFSMKSLHSALSSALTEEPFVV